MDGLIKIKDWFLDVELTLQESDSSQQLVVMPTSPFQSQTIRCWFNKMRLNQQNFLKKKKKVLSKVGKVRCHVGMVKSAILYCYAPDTNTHPGGTSTRRYSDWPCMHCKCWQSKEEYNNKRTDQLSLLGWGKPNSLNTWHGINKYNCCLFFSFYFPSIFFSVFRLWL